MIPYFRFQALEIFGPIKIQPWGLLVATGFIVSMVVAQRYAKRRGWDPRIFSDVVVWMAAGGLVFAHLGHALLYEPARYLSKPWELFFIWEGLSSIGGILGCTVLAVYFGRKRGLHVLKFGDLLMLGLTSGWFIGRMGCFVVHDHIGRAVEESPTVLRMLLGWTAIDFPQEFARVAVRSASGTFLRWEHLPTLRFDQGLLDSLLAGVVFLVLAWLARSPRRPGVLLGMTPMVYAPGRFALDFLRNEDLGHSDVRYFGLTPAQYGCMVILVAGFFVLRRAKRYPPWPEPGTKPFVDPEETGP